MHLLETGERHPEAVQPTPHRRTAATRFDREKSLQLVAGMPELNACGLSETWLQRTCGSQHWLALAQALGQPSDRWVDTRGRRVYAAFGWLRLREAQLDQSREGQSLRLNSRLRWLGRSHAWSHHRLASADIAMAELDMLSVFVSRHQAGDNHSVRRADMAEAMVDDPTPDTAGLLGRLRQWRQASTTRHPAVRSWRTTPCPRSDFNGAGLLYFPSFTALADRAMWHWGLLEVHSTVLSRECLFLGNVGLGESIDVLLLETQASGPCSRFLLQFVSADVGRRLAEVEVFVNAPHSRSERWCSNGSE
ncbi:MAG: hypothetical protein IV088_03795 [Hydrogenophaga sp.]|uniref:Pnap_2097 family protein n=1 Tax=Hydrogenophaga sp. TaxID=1904254 RepID=UPI0025C703AB|nr:Pnap_2097 family protein [Hydrogenophaga sp.]MBT9549951.1 hypothetical protein [Hydrogenophaga sp.]